MAKHGHKWWEVDTTYWVILCLEKLGLAWNVVHNPPKAAFAGPPKAALARMGQ
jgi:stearoyl-CoA desaturase (delta-9 desaturase)